MRRLPGFAWVSLLTLTGCVAGIRAPAPDAEPPDSGAPLSDPTTEPADEWPEQCPDATRYIYLLTGFAQAGAQGLVRFDPGTGTSTRVGTVDCGEDTWVSAFAVDREGQAWMAVRRSSGESELRPLDLASGHCASSGVSVGLPAGVAATESFLSSLALVSSPDSAEETLYATIYDDWMMTHLGRAQFGGGATIDLVDLATSIDLFPFLTGNGAGQLFLLNAFDGGAIERVEVQDGRTTPVVDIADLVAELWQGEGGRVVAAGFVVWGDAFYVFVSRQGATTATAFRVSASGAYEVVVEDLGALVLTAAVSTCASTELF